MNVLPHTRNELNLCLKQNRRDHSYRDTLLTFFLQKCGAYLRAVLNTIVIPLSTVFTRISAAALINSPNPMRRLFQGGACSSNYCNWQLKSLLHLGQIVITFRTLLHLGQNVITFRNLLHLGSFITCRLLHPLSSSLRTFLSEQGAQHTLPQAFRRQFTYLNTL